MAGLLVLVAAEFVLRRTWNGDASIYLPYARSTAAGDPFSFNPSEFSSGSTSPLWAVLLAIPVGLSSALGALKAFFALFSAVAYAVTFGAAASIGRSWLGAAIGSSLLVTTLTRPAAVGFESSLVVALVAASLWLGARLAERDRLSRRALLPLVVVWAALPLARPEAALLVMIELVALCLVRRHARREVITLFACACLAALPAIAYFGYSILDLGVVSTSTAGRSAWLREHGNRLGPLYVSDFAIRYLFTSPVVYAFVPGIAGLLLLARERATRFAAGYALAGVAAYLLLLTFVSPGFLDTGRYLLPISPFVVLGIAALARALAEQRVALAAAVLLGGLLIVRPAVQVLVDDAPAIRDTPYTFDNNLERGAADVLNREAAPGSTVLAYEVQVRWFLRPDLRVLSLDGITDGKVLPYSRRNDLRGFLLHYRPRYWVADPTADPPEPGADRPGYITNSPLGRAMSALSADRSRRVVEEDGIRFTVLARRARPLPYPFGPWTAVLELSYPGAPR